MNKETKRILFQVGLFLVTFITTTLAGTEWAFGKSIYRYTEKDGVFMNLDYAWSDFANGLYFSIPLLLVLTVHEFGHYFMAVYHKIKTSLPYYIPIPPIPGIPLFGTMGAVIRIRTKPESNVENFDIGLAGPLAGFVVALIIMAYGFLTLPTYDYVFKFHPEYKQFGEHYPEVVYSPAYLKEHNQGVDVRVGSNLIFWTFGKVFGDPSRLPNVRELMHYPVLFACYVALFFTSLNLLPIGQLDGGHVIYGLFGFKKHRVVATVFFIALMFFAGLGLPYIDPSLPKLWLLCGIIGYSLFLILSFRGLGLPFSDTVMYALLMVAIQFLLMVTVPGISGYQGWLIFGFLLGRIIGVQHPPSDIEQPLDTKRVVLGWLTLAVFVLCFTPEPIVIELVSPSAP